MPKYLRIFFTALMFYTRIPVPKSTGYSAENLNRATAYFPLVGILLGGIAAFVFVISKMILPANIAILLSISVVIITTGAFHEDAIADFADGFGGGYSKNKILTIMKDSHIGTYGALALIVLVLSKYLLLNEFDMSVVPYVFIVAHGVSRLNPVFLIFTADYVADIDKSKSKPVGEKSSMAILVVATIFGLLPLMLLNIFQIIVIVVVLTGIFIYFRYYVKKHIGGYTGDVLGALQQLSEVGIYLALLSVSGIATSESILQIITG